MRKAVCLQFGSANGKGKGMNYKLQIMNYAMNTTFLIPNF